MRKKLMFIIPTLDAGGAEKVTINILKEMDRTNYEIKLVVFNSNGPLKKSIPKDIDVVVVTAKRLRYALLGISKLLVKFKPDYIFSTIGHLNLAMIFLKTFLRLKSKLIVREASTPSRYLGQLKKSKAFIYVQLYKKLYPKADIIVAQCDSMKNDLVEKMGISESKIVRIYNPVNIEEIHKKSEIYYPKEYMDDYINIVSVGRLVEAKGFDILIKSFKLLTDKHKEKMRLFIIGEGHLKDSLEELTNDLDLKNSISFLGFVENPYPYIKNADLFVLSSRWEGFPNTVLEALACGQKVVATDCESGPKEIVGEDKYGLLAEVDNPHSLYKRICEYMSLENRSVNRAEDFKIEKIVKQYQELFR